MNKNAFSLTLALFKTLVLTGCLFYAASSGAQAQSIVGTWKLTDAKETITDKASGKTQDISAQMQEVIKQMQQTIVFNADNTYSFSNSMAGAKKGLEVTGTYSVSGNEIKLSQGQSNMSAASSKP